jgi:hypothetical protein
MLKYIYLLQTEYLCPPLKFIFEGFPMSDGIGALEWAEGN